METKTAKKILVLEDERPMAKALEIKLGRTGYAVTVVHNGTSGLEALSRDTYDLIMCDLIMPTMDGFQFLEELRKRNITTPVMVMTNLSQEEDKEKAMNLGARAFIVKSDTPISDIVERAKNIFA
jgi:DNA-binding response OmpR family regulator